MIEVAVVLALMAAAMVAFLPRLSSGDSLAADEAARTTANAALDVALAQAVQSPNPDGTLRADPVEMHAVSGDVRFVPAATESPDQRTASVAASGGRLAVAVLGDAATGACWYTWRDTASSAADPSAYFVRTSGSALPCTAETALTLTRDGSGEFGGSWAAPQPVA